MSKMLTSWELSPLFSAGSGFLSGGELEASFLLIRAGRIFGWLSIFRVFWARTAPRSLSGWLSWAAIYGVLALMGMLLSNHWQFDLGIFVAPLLMLVVPICKCVQSTNEKYEWSMKWCDTVVNANRQGAPLISRESIRQIVLSQNVNNLAEFKIAQSKLIPVKTDTELVSVPKD